MKLFPRTAIVAAAFACSFVPSFTSKAIAKDFVDASTHLGLTAPDDWKSTEGAPLMLSAADDQAHVIVMHVDPDNVQAALASLGEELKGTITDTKMNGDETSGEVNGLPEIHASGTGMHGDVAVHFSVAVVDAGEDCLVVFAFGTEDGLKEHGEEVNGIFGSIKKD